MEAEIPSPARPFRSLSRPAQARCRRRQPLTDAQGRAAARFVSDPKVGVNTATATIAGAAPVTFSVTTIAGPCEIALDQGADPDRRCRPARDLPTITAVDSNGNAVPSTQIDFTARTPSVVTMTSDGGIVGVGLAADLRRRVEPTRR